MRLSANQFHDSITITPLIGEGAYGPVSGNSYACAACVEPGLSKVVDKNGQEIVASAFAILPSDSAVGIGDAAEFEGRRYEVVDAQIIRADGVVHHVEIYLKSVGEMDD
jgi:hypothetical protein